MTVYGRLVYFARKADGTGPIKIGASGYPESRVKQLSCDHGHKIEVLVTAEGDLAAERALHRRFAGVRTEVPSRREGLKSPIGGKFEWYEPTPELLGLIDDLAAGRATLPKVDERTVEMAKHYLEGETLAAVGSRFGLTRERIRQLLNQHGFPSNPRTRMRYIESISA